VSDGLRLEGSSRTALGLQALWPLLLRLAFILATPHFAPNNDPADYDHIARSLASGHGYPPTLLAAPGTPSALRPPGYPLLLAAVYTLGGHWGAGRVVNALLGALAVLLIYLIATGLWDRRHGLIAGGLAAVFPPLIALNGSLLSEPLFIVLELLFVLVVMRYQNGRRRLLYAGLIGALCGAAALTRSIGLLLPVAGIVGMAAAPDATRSQALGSVTAMLAAMCVVIAPWAIRNADAFHGAFVPVSTQDGITAAGTYNARAATSGPLYAIWRPPYFVPGFHHLFGDSIDEAQLDRVLRDDAVSYAAAHPGYALAALGLNTLRLAYIGPHGAAENRQWYYEMDVSRNVRPWASISGGVVIAAAVLGVVAALIRARARRRQAARSSGRRRLFVWLVPFLMYVSVVPIQGAFRYRAPIDPFLVMLAAYAAVSLSEYAHWGRARAPTASTL
jgi:4-amino-4-deoxy-L-arabinose transferase-like glycosyltransferase